MKTDLIKRKTTIDGILIGTQLETGIIVEDNEVTAIRKLLIEYGGHEEGLDVKAIIPGVGGSMVLALRRDKNTKEFFLNLSGNPITFMYVDNTYGYAEADVVIVKAFNKCLGVVSNKWPARIKNAVKKKDINIHSLEFATYTIPVENKADILDAWYHVYLVGSSSIDGRSHTGLMDMLDLQINRKHKSHKSSVALQIMSSDGRDVEAMLLAYDKAKQMRDSGVEVPEDIENRIRLDLNLKYGWFRRRRIDGDVLKTLHDLSAYIKKRCDGDWLLFLSAEFKWALERTCLFHMWSFDPAPILDRTYAKGEMGEGYLDLPYEAYFAMLDARSRLRVTDEDRRQFLIGNSAPLVAKLNTAPLPVVISLDMV